MQTTMMRSTPVQSRTCSRTGSFTVSRACPKARKQVVVTAQVCSVLWLIPVRLAGLHALCMQSHRPAFLLTGRGQGTRPGKGSKRTSGRRSCSTARSDRYVISSRSDDRGLSVRWHDIPSSIQISPPARHATFYLLHDVGRQLSYKVLACRHCAGFRYPLPEGYPSDPQPW